MKARKRKEPLPERTWNNRFYQLATDYLIIIECKTCKSPVISGNICTFCDDINPSSEE